MWLASAGVGVLWGTLARAQTVKASAWTGESRGFMFRLVKATTGALNKTVPGPRGGDTWGVPAAPDFPAVESGNGGERGGLATWTSGNPRAHGFQQNTSSGMTVNLGFQIRGTQTFNI